MLQLTFGEALQWMVGEALQQTAGREVLQQMGGRCCNELGRWDGKDATDIAIFHSGWTTVNDATAIYGSYHESCNKVPCTLPSLGYER